MAHEQMSEQQMEFYLSQQYQDMSGGFEKFNAARQGPQSGDKRKADWDEEPIVQNNEPKRLHLARVEELSITNPARARELEYMGRELVLKRDCLQISLSIYNELKICLQALFDRLASLAPASAGESSWNDWIMDLTAQMHQMQIQISADEDEVREMEDKYRKAFCARL
ncbi:hypothetical protein N7540_006937 [Penicillium herquei]|nr:hypothetical protein N7540_006937 [Penicillium herquei]